MNIIVECSQGTVFLNLEFLPSTANGWMAGKVGGDDLLAMTGASSNLVCSIIWSNWKWAQRCLVSFVSYQLYCRFNWENLRSGGEHSAFHGELSAAVFYPRHWARRQTWASDWQQDRYCCDTRRNGRNWKTSLWGRNCILYMIIIIDLG